VAARVLGVLGSSQTYNEASFCLLWGFVGGFFWGLLCISKTQTNKNQCFTAFKKRQKISICPKKLLNQILLVQRHSQQQPAVKYSPNALSKRFSCGFNNL